LIGRNGANIRKIRELTGARILFPTDSEANSSKERDIITIVGREESVKKAREELEARIKELVRNASFPSSSVSSCWHNARNGFSNRWLDRAMMIAIISLKKEKEEKEKKKLDLETIQNSVI